MYSTKEKIVSGFALVLFLFSGWQLSFGGWEGAGLFTLIKGGHNYNEGLVGEIIRLNPVYADLNEVDRDITSLIFEGLSKYDPIQRKFVENIATHTLDGSKTLYTFILKDGLTWHDGAPLTADDLYFTFHDVIQHPEFENPILKANFDGVTVEKIDYKTVTMKLNEPNSFFFTQLTVGILPRHLLKDIPVAELDTHEFNQAPVGNGPYRVDGPYQRDNDGSSEVQLSYYDDYWKSADPEITEIHFHAFMTFEDMVSAKGQLHGVARIPQYRLTEMEGARFAAYPYTLPQYTALFLDTDDEFLRKRNIRLAIQKAIDKTKILSAIGYDRAIDTPLLELNQDDWIYQPNPKEAAGALYDEKWFLDKAAGLRKNEEGDKQLTFVLVRRTYPNNEKQEEVARVTAEMIAEQLKAVGIGVTLESYEDKAFEAKVQKRDYDMLLYGQSLGYNLDTYSYWHASQSQTGLNLSNYGNNKADFFIEAIRDTFGDDDEQKTEYLEKLAEILKEDIPAVFLYTPTYAFMVDERIQGIQTKHLLFPHDRFFNILSWRIED